MIRHSDAGRVIVGDPRFELQRYEHYQASMTSNGSMETDLRIGNDL